MWPPNCPSSSLFSHDLSAKPVMNAGSLTFKIPTVGEMGIPRGLRDGLIDQTTTLDHSRMLHGRKDGLNDQTATLGQAMILGDLRDGLIDQIETLTRARTEGDLIDGTTRTGTLPKGQLQSAGARRR